MKNVSAKRKAWSHWFAGATRTGRFSQEAIEAAGEWPTCMCGAQHAQIPRSGISGGPLDDELDALGLEFMRHVEAHRVAEAKRVGAAIDKRAGEILRELRTGSKP